jgi:hypothetical protein
MALLKRWTFDRVLLKEILKKSPMFFLLLIGIFPFMISHLVLGIDHDNWLTYCMLFEEEICCVI